MFLENKCAYMLHDSYEVKMGYGTLKDRSLDFIRGFL